MSNPVSDCAPTDSSKPLVSAIILAAGASRRFGEAKLLAPLPGMDGRRVLQVTVDNALQLGLHQVIVVVGCHAAEMASLLAGCPLQIVVNPRWEEGMSTSMQAGLDHVSPESHAVLLMLGDQPAVSPATARLLVDAYRAFRSPIVVPAFEGRRGNPALFDRCTFDSLRRVAGDQGGRQLIVSGAFDVAQIEVDDRAVIMDVDRSEDLSTLSTYLKERGNRQ
jgi:molybdenum cofactor cytidylyltransferase